MSPFPNPDPDPSGTSDPLNSAAIPRPEQHGAPYEDAIEAKRDVWKTLSGVADVAGVSIQRASEGGFVLRVYLEREPDDPEFRMNYATIGKVPVDYEISGRLEAQREE